MQPSPLLLPGEFHGQRSLVGYTTEVTKSSSTVLEETGIIVKQTFILFLAVLVYINLRSVLVS